MRFRSSTRFAVQRSVSMSCRERTTMDRPSRSAAETMKCADVSAYALPVMPFIATSTPKLRPRRRSLVSNQATSRDPTGRSQLGSCARSFAPSRAMPRMIARATSRAARRAGGGRAQTNRTQTRHQRITSDATDAGRRSAFPACARRRPRVPAPTLAPGVRWAATRAGEARRALDEFDAGGAYSRREHHRIAASTVDTIETKPISHPSEGGARCRCSGRGRGPGRVCRAYRRGHQGGAGEHQDEPGDACGDLERVASHRVPEDENAGQDG